MRIHVETGYRVYYMRSGKTVYVLLAGGNKSSQKKDITLAKKMAREFKETKKMKKIKTTFAAFDAVAYLDNDTVITEYLSAAVEDPNPDAFIAALGDVAKARGMARIARGAGLGRESLYKALSAGAHPRYETINAVLHALGVKFAVAPISG